MLTNRQRQEIINLWRSGNLSLKVSNNHISIIEDGVDHMSNAQAPEYNNETGWATNVASDIGGLRSKRVDATILETKSLGYEDAAAKIPQLHICHFWAAPSTIFGWATPDPTRFSLPQSDVGLTQEELNQIQDNLMALDVWTAGISATFGLNGSTNYRGERGKSGFAPVNVSTSEVDFSPANPPGYVPNRLETAFPQQLVAAKYQRVYANDGHTWNRKLVQEHPEQFVYDSYWDTRTDENVNRYWRNWLISVGVPIKLEV